MTSRTTLGTEPVSLALIEPTAGVGGHWQQAAMRLCQQATAAGMRCVVVASGAVPDAVGRQLHAAGADLVRRPVASAGWLLATAAATIATVAAGARRLARHRRWPHQLAALGRALAEAAALRTAAATAPAPRVLVVLSASGVLHGLTAALSGQAHLRVVHETPTVEDRILRLLARLAHHGEQQVALVCPTDTVRQQLAARYPRPATLVWPFALADAEPRLSEAERAAARAAFDLAPDDLALALVGGWWPHKDIATLVAAVAGLDRPVSVLVAGHPLDPDLLAALAAAVRGRLVVHAGAVPRSVVRCVYAAADATVVARHRGVGKESGLVANAAVLGAPLLVSDHDPTLTARLSGLPWVRLFPAGDPGALAAAITGLAERPPPRPGPTAATDLGLPAAAATLAAYTTWSTKLPKEPTPCPSR
jgi:hypothetical protein